MEKLENFTNSENVNPNTSNKNNNKLLGKKQKKPTEKSGGDKLLKSINKLTMEENNNNSETSESSEYISDSDEDVIINEESELDSDEEDNHPDNDIDMIQSNSKTNTKNKPKEPTKEEKKIWNEKTEKLKDNEELVFDNSAYEMLVRSQVTWPCYSVDWVIPEFFIPQPIKNFYAPIKTKLYEDTYPYSVYFLAGSQTSEKNGILYYMKWFNLHRTLYDGDPDNEADSESEGGEPLMDHIAIKAKGNINKVRTMKHSNIAAYWSDLGSIELVNIQSHIEKMEERWKDDEDKEADMNKKPQKKRKIEAKDCHVKSFKKKSEGFALDWNNFLPGVFACGGYDNEIEVFLPKDENCSDYIGGENNIYNYRNKFDGHKNGVEDIVFSPVAPHILASSGNDKFIKLWDLRMNTQNNLIGSIENAHSSDVNCLAWKSSTGIEMIASGSDDSTIKIWDPRKMSNNKDYIANIEFHKDPITSLHWDPSNPCQLAATSEDNRLSIWDFSVEPDKNTKKNSSEDKVPDQLVFLHQGQENIKDVKFHPYYNDFLISTAETGINVFKPNFNGEESDDEE